NNKNIPAHSIKPLCLLKLERYTDVLNYYDDLPEEAFVPQEKIGMIGLAYTLLKDKKNTNAYLSTLEKEAKKPNGFTANSCLFMMYAAMGEIDKAFDWVSDALKNNSPLLALRFADPIVGSLRKDERY